MSAESTCDHRALSIAAMPSPGRVGALTAFLAERRNAGMTDNRYAVGSTVYIWRRPSLTAAVAGAFTVVAHYPSRSSGRLYRIRAVLGMEERMVPEADLSNVPRSSDAVERTPRTRRSA